MQDRSKWMVILRRMDGSVNFDREWEEYKNGFGSLTGEFWAGDSMAYHNSTYFSTRNYDHDTHIYSCAVMFDAPWWFGACHSSLLTGEYGRNLSYARGITW
ncbi:hypothetical protein LSH36_1124g00006, partial [Paralvinella palmiformis]